MKPVDRKNPWLKAKAWLRLFCGSLLMGGFLLLQSAPSEATGVMEFTRVERTQQGGAGARQGMVDSAIEGASLQLIRELIGEERVEKNRDLIQQKIIQNSSRYVQSIKTGSPRQSQQGLEMEVRLRLSTPSLEKLLLAEGLLYKMEGAPRVLPMIAIADRIQGQNLLWWMGNHQNDKELQPLLMAFSSFIDALRGELQPKGFFVLNPLFANAWALTPEVYRSENLPKEDLLWLSDFYEAQVLLRGEIVLDRDPDRSDRLRLDQRLLAMQAKNGRVIGEVVRSFSIERSAGDRVLVQKLTELGPQVAKDLTVQISDAWKSGTFGANLVQLAINGSLSYLQSQALKKALQAEYREIKNMKERQFAPNRLVFEVDLEGSTLEWSQKFAQSRLSAFRMQILDVSPDRLELKVEAL